MKLHSNSMFAKWFDNEFLILPFLCFLALITRIPFRTFSLYNYDSVNFALGMGEFNLEKSQPHPPGYILYIIFARALNLITKDPNAAMVWLSILSGILSVCLLYMIGKERFRGQYGFLSAILLMTSPLVWFYNEVALTYSMELLFSLLVAYACYKTLAGSIAWAYLAALALAIAGGIRQTTLFLFLPLTLFSIAHLPKRQIFPVLLVLVLTCLVWFIPLLILAGGWDAYMNVSRQLAVLVSSVSTNFSDFTYGLLIGGHIALLLLLGYFVQIFDLQMDACPSWEKWFVFLWVMPPLFEILYIHMGQLGYLLVLLPPLFLYTPSLLAGLLLQIGDFSFFHSSSPLLTLEQKVFVTTILLTCIGGFIFVYMITPTISQTNRRVDIYRELPVKYSPTQTVILTDYDTFRRLAYYLTDYHIYAFTLVANIALPLPPHLSNEVLGWTNHSYHDKILAAELPQKELLLPPGTKSLLVTNSVIRDALIKNQKSGYKITQDDTFTDFSFRNQIHALIVSDGGLKVH